MKTNTTYRYSRLKETFPDEEGKQIVSLFVNIRTSVVSKIEDEIVSEQIFCGPSIHLEKPLDEMTEEIQALPISEIRLFISENEYNRLNKMFSEDVDYVINYGNQIK